MIQNLGLLADEGGVVAKAGTFDRRGRNCCHSWGFGQTRKEPLRRLVTTKAGTFDRRSKGFVSKARNF